MNAHPALFFAAFTAPTVIDDGAVHQKPLGVSFRDSVMPNRPAPATAAGVRWLRRHATGIDARMAQPALSSG
jgi:hypothetical protein